VKEKNPTVTGRIADTLGSAGVARIGLVTPVLTAVPGAHARWEREAGLAEVVAVARAADELGYDHLTCSEHVAVPADVEATRGATYWDPLATFGYLAAVTSRIRLATSVLVLGYHHPLAIAKRYGTLDAVSGGRLVLGVGVGSLAEEFELLGAPFADRGERADDALRALRASLSMERASYHGPHYDYDDLVVRPHAVQARVPIWVGGRTRRSLRRAVELADGWMPFGLGVDELRAMLATVDRPAGFDLVLAPTRALDPGERPDDVLAALGALRDVGCTIVSARIVSRSVEHYVDQLHRLAALSARSER
jgi:probable F420-dependent oxidoreductase